MAIALQPLADQIVDILLGLVPEHTVVEPYRDANLNNWRRAGAYSLISSSRQYIEIKVAQREYAAVIVAECHHLLNQAAEHRALLLGALSSTQDPSPSWKLVSLYYMSLYLVLSLSRATNEAVIFLDREGLNNFSNEQHRPHAGTFIFSHEMDSSTFISKVRLKKANSNHFHEAAWLTAHRFMRSARDAIVSSTANRRPNEQEILSLRAANLFFGLSFRDAETWPSVFRNAINYRSRYSYRTVLRHNFLPNNLGIARQPLRTAEEAIIFGETAHRSLRGIAHPAEESARSLELLIVQSLIIENVVTLALKRIENLRELECSAFRQRNVFSRANCARESLLSMLPIQ